MYRSHNVVIAAGWALPDCPSRRAFGSKAVTARAVGHEGAAQIIPNSTNVRLVRSMQTRVHIRVRQLLGRSAGET